LVDTVQRLGAIGLQIDENALGPTTRLVGFSEGDALTDKTSRAVEQLSGLSDGEKASGLHCLEAVNENNALRIAGILSK